MTSWPLGVNPAAVWTSSSTWLLSPPLRCSRWITFCSNRPQDYAVVSTQHGSLATVKNVPWTGRSFQSIFSEFVCRCRGNFLCPSLFHCPSAALWTRCPRSTAWFWYMASWWFARENLGQCGEPEIEIAQARGWLAEEMRHTMPSRV